VYAAVSATDILSALKTSLSAFVAVGFAVAFALFAVGVIKVIHNSGDETAITAGKKQVLWGVVGLFLIASVWGIVWVVQVLMFGSGSTAADAECQSTYIEVGGTTFTGKVCP